MTYQYVNLRHIYVFDTNWCLIFYDILSKLVYKVVVCMMTLIYNFFITFNT